MAAHDPIIIARFWSKVDVRRPMECWPWKASMDRHGYGQFKGTSGLNPRQAHRFAYSLVNGEPSEGAVIRHRCNNRACCNPNHLVEGTVKDNHDDREAAGRCPRDQGRFAQV